MQQEVRVWALERSIAWLRGFVFESIRVELIVKIDMISDICGYVTIARTNTGFEQECRVWVGGAPWSAPVGGVPQTRPGLSPSPVREPPPPTPRGRKNWKNRQRPVVNPINMGAAIFRNVGRNRGTQGLCPPYGKSCHWLTTHSNLSEATQFYWNGTVKLAGSQLDFAAKITDDILFLFAIHWSSPEISDPPQKSLLFAKITRYVNILRFHYPFRFDLSALGDKTKQ